MILLLFDSHVSSSSFRTLSIFFFRLSSSWVAATGGGPEGPADGWSGWSIVGVSANFLPPSKGFCLLSLGSDDWLTGSGAWAVALACFTAKLTSLKKSNW